MIIYTLPYILVIQGMYWWKASSDDKAELGNGWRGFNCNWLWRKCKVKKGWGIEDGGNDDYEDEAGWSDGPWIDIGFPPPIMVVTSCHWQQSMASGFLWL